jgi:hypothetical protein
MHRYVMARYEVETFDDYIHILALFRNTRAIEAVKARQRVFELTDISTSVDVARQLIRRRLQLRRSKS